LDNKEEEEILAHSFVQRFQILSSLLLWVFPYCFFYFVAYYDAPYLNAMSS